MKVTNSFPECLQARPILIRALEEGNFDALVDPRLGSDYDRNEMTRMVACVAACVRHSAKLRPRMSQVFPFSNFSFSIFCCLSTRVLCFSFSSSLFL